VFLRNETRAKPGFVSYVSISLCFDFDPIIHRSDGQPVDRQSRRLCRGLIENG
jgi:hypothetical protein